MYRHTHTHISPRKLSCTQVTNTWGCVCVRLCACICVCVEVCMCSYLSTYMYICYMFICVCEYMHLHTYINTNKSDSSIPTHICIDKQKERSSHKHTQNIWTRKYTSKITQKMRTNTNRQYQSIKVSTLILMKRIFTSTNIRIQICVYKYTQTNIHIKISVYIFVRWKIRFIKV